MSGARSAALPRSAAERLAALRQPQEETILSALLPLAVAGIAFIACSGLFVDPLQANVPGTALLVLPLLIWLLHERCYLGAAWLLVGGVSAIVLYLAVATGVTAPLYLLALATGLAALFVGVAAGALTALLWSALLVAPPQHLLAVDVPFRLVTLAGIWGTLGLIWLTTRPLLTTLHWAWTSYEESRYLLESARDYQVRLKQTLADLAEANLQLTRLNRLTQSLRQAAEGARLAKEQFVANVSHELRTPLNMIVGFGEMILQSPRMYGPLIPPALLADLSVIVRNSQHLSALIDDVLDLSQIEAGQMALTRERVSLCEIVRVAAEAVRPLYESKGLALEIEALDDAVVYCDRTRIREVVLNLLSNAGRFTEQGGVRIRTWREGGDLVVSVTDTGPGIAAERQEKLFQPFQQLDGSIRRRYGGTGLGLAISKSFVELHGGRMWLESELDKGATFFFRLPVEPPAPLSTGVDRWFHPDWRYEERSHPSLAPVARVQPRYLVVEHGSTLRRLLARYGGNVDIVPVAGFAQAAQEMARGPAQALVVNVATVSEALQQIKDEGGALLASGGAPAIVCSLPEPADAADALGATDYLVKPISREMLQAVLDRLQPRGKTILVVDDEPEALQLFHRMLVSMDRGYRVLLAPNGREALAALREQRPDVVFLDLVMPEMDGFRLLEARSQDPALRAIPIVVISALDPAGQPIVSDTLAVTHRDGLSVPQLLACIEAISRILGKSRS